MIIPCLARWPPVCPRLQPTRPLAAKNAMRYPERSTRTTIEDAVIAGVALVTMFAAAARHQ